MLPALIEFVLAPVLAGVATVGARRWGARAGGVVSAFPAIVGPVLLLDALERGPAFTARAANSALLGLAALAAFAIGYERSARQRTWAPSVMTGWICAALAALAVGWLAGGLGSPAGLVVAVGSLTVAHRVLQADPPAGQPRVRRPSAASEPAEMRLDPSARTAATARRDLPARTAVTARHDLLMRMAATALLVLCLSAASAALGALVGGILTALPVLASVLAAFTHRQHGTAAAGALLHGTVAGMAGYVAFVEVVALLILGDGIVEAFATGTVVAMLVQLLAASPAPMVALMTRTRRGESAA